MNKTTIIIENNEIKIMSDFTVIKKSTNEEFLLTNNLSLDNKKTDIVSIFKINKDDENEPLTFINYFFCVNFNDLIALLNCVTSYLKELN